MLASCMQKVRYIDKTASCFCSSYSQLIICSHHPCIANNGISNQVWKKLQRILQTHGYNIVGIVAANLEPICKDLLGSTGLFSSSTLEQLAAAHSLLILMIISPNDLFIEFENHFNTLPYHSLHDMLIENAIKIADIDQELIVEVLTSEKRVNPILLEILLDKCQMG
ncbi:protein ILITYHIA-like isoform X2 [Curcuma longa]|uniref:protein ILITYHIA-like isoform X2 n=1 Tax=Curcuma longa TaxID=136217 RepID=UPI003D9E6E54